MTQWNKIYKRGSKKYDYYNILTPHEDMDKIIKLFKKHNVKNVLDLGCGAGRNLWYLAEKKFNVRGIDSAKEGLNIAKDILKKKNLKANLKAGDVFKKLPYENNFFDAIVSIQVMQHAKENIIRRAVKEIERILKPNGLIFFTLCGRYSKGEIRYCLVKTAKKIAPHTYVPTTGGEKGLTHFIYTKSKIKDHYKNFKIKDFWRDKRDYYCFVGTLTKR